MNKKTSSSSRNSTTSSSRIRMKNVLKRGRSTSKRTADLTNQSDSSTSSSASRQLMSKWLGTSNTVSNTAKRKNQDCLTDVEAAARSCPQKEEVEGGASSSSSSWTDMSGRNSWIRSRNYTPPRREELESSSNDTISSTLTPSSSASSCSVHQEPGNLTRSRALWGDDLTSAFGMESGSMDMNTKKSYGSMTFNRTPSTELDYSS